MNTLKKGDKAPDFQLVNQNNQVVKLSDFQGKKVLVYFYPKAMTPGCTTQACALRDNIEAFNDLNVEVLGISPDAYTRLTKFRDRDSLNFTLLSDEDHQIADAFGVWGEKKFMGKIFDGVHRISFLIDENGHIEMCFDNFKTSNHHEVVLNYLKQNK